MSFSPKFKITNSISSAIAKIERTRGFLDAARLSDDWIEAMQARALILEAHSTTHIEGTHLTLEESARLMTGNKVPGADPDEARELLNYKRAFEFVSGYLNSGRPVTEALIREIHRCLVQRVRGNTAAPGAYRKIQNFVVNSGTGKTIYTPPPPHNVPPLMSELVDYLSEDQETGPILLAGIAQFQLVHIHPFIDGNGRTARLLSTLCLYRAGYDFKRLFSISEFYDRDRTAYYKAIQGVRQKNMDFTGWLEYFVAGLALQMREVQDRGERIIRRDVIAHKHELSQKQRLALGHILEHGHLTIKEFENLNTGVTRRTLQREISAMVKMGLLSAIGSTNQLRYQLGKKAR